MVAAGGTLTSPVHRPCRASVVPQRPQNRCVRSHSATCDARAAIASSGSGSAEEQRAETGESKSGRRRGVVRQNHRDAADAGKLAQVMANAIDAGGMRLVLRRYRGRVLGPAEEELRVAEREHECRAGQHGTAAACDEMKLSGVCKGIAGRSLSGVSWILHYRRVCDAAAALRRCALDARAAVPGAGAQR